MIENEEYNDSIVYLKKLVIEQLNSSKDSNLEYHMCMDYIHNHKNENYRNMMTNRTGESASDLYKKATTFIADMIYHQLVSLGEEKRVEIMNEPSAMTEFIDCIHKKIKEENKNVFLRKS